MNTSRQRRFTLSMSEYPFESHWFERDGSFMHYLDEGEGFPVLLLHGNPTWSFLYRKIIQQLKGSCRLIVPDYPGFGLSDHPSNYNYTPQEHAEWVNALVDDLKLDRFILMVQDWGGPIGLSIAVNRPDDVAGLVIANTWGWKAEYPVWRIFSAIFSSPLGKYLILRRNFLVQRMLPTMFFREESKTPDVLDAYRAPFQQPDSRVGIYAFVKALTKSGNWLASIESRLHTLADKPVEFIIGSKDLFFAKENIITRWQRHFPNAPMEQVADAGHFVQEEEPDRVVSAIQRILAVQKTAEPG